MAHPQIAVFPRLAEENTPPTRLIAGQKTRLARTMHDIRYDPVHDEILVTNPFALALLVFRGGADGEEAPIRVIQGSNTRLSGHGTGGLDRLDVDPVHNEIFVPNGSSVLVFSRTATGNVAPIRVLEGPDTRLSGTTSLAVDPVNNVLVVLESGYFLIFNRTDQGNVKPRAAIAPPSDLSFRGSSQFQLYPPKGWIFVSVQSRQQSGDTRHVEFEGAGFGVWSIRDDGQVPPRWLITGPQSLLKRPRGIALNPKDKEVYVAEMRQNAILTYFFPEVF